MKFLFKPVFYSVCGLPKFKFFILLSEAMLIQVQRFFSFFQQNIKDTVKSYHSSSAVLVPMNGSYVSLSSEFLLFFLQHKVTVLHC